MEKMYKSFSWFNELMNMPAPRINSMLLAVFFWSNQIVGMTFHSAINLWLATITSIFAIIRYSNEFITWLKEQLKKRKK